MQQFTGKVAVVTGAASGMGRAFAEKFAAEGMKVVLADIEEPALAEAVQALESAGHSVIGVVTDVSQPESIEALAQRTIEAFGKVHILCNNAGVEGYLRGPLWEATDKDWAWTLGVDFWSVVYGVRTFLPLMLAQDEEGHVVNTASTMGLAFGGNMYGIAKHAVVATSEVLYAQLKQQQAKIGISVLCPGMVNTKIFQGARNRPAALRNEDEDFRFQGPNLSTAMSPSAVADILFEAIKNDQFYVLTDDEWDDRIRARWDNIINRRNPDITAVRPSRTGSTP